MQKNTKNIIWFLVVLIILYGAFVLVVNRNEQSLGDDIKNVDQSKVDPQISGRVEDLVSFSILPGQEVSGLTSYSGVIKGGWFFEANIIVNVLDVNKKVLLKGYAMTTEDWMTGEPLPFGNTIDFTNLPKGPAYIQIKNDNPSDDRTYDKEILIPVTIL